MSQKSKMVVADIYRLGRQGGKFVQAGRVLERKGAVITRAWAEQHNAIDDNCMFFEIDEEATKEWEVARDENIAKMQANREKGKIDHGKLAEALVGKLAKDEKEPAKKTTTRKARKPKVEENETED